MPLIGVVIGSRTDEPLIQPTLDLLQQLGIQYEFNIMSAHRNPERVREYASKARERGIEVIIAAAGAAAHLPGVLASWTTLPIIGVPLPTSELKGIDSLYSIVQMPPGVPVSCVGIGTSGAKNAALLATQILGIKYQEARNALEKYKLKLAEQ
ncbi:MAG TPA: 5-(carboxyamino)imidazole ribonucleotide mutase [Dehalococcoidia bacterium]|nr:5-(carboxyamino)imidazole ribonucleotide mutase [Dehalococcoidia bacterium]